MIFNLDIKYSCAIIVVVPAMCFSQKRLYPKHVGVKPTKMLQH